MRVALLLIFIAFNSLATASAALLDRPVATDSTPNHAIAEPVPLPELELTRIAVEPDDFPSIRVRDSKSDAVFNVYYDLASEPIAEQSIPVLASFYRDIAALTGVDPAAVNWEGVIFVRHADDVVLRSKKGQTRWKIDVDADGKLTVEGRKGLYVMIPHEQTHSVQFGHRLPHWFLEGQAEWVGLQLTEKWQPVLARQRRKRHATELSTNKEPIALVSWSSIQPKREAMLRQLTPAQRAEVEKDPSKMPPGPFVFGPDDFVSGVSNIGAHYAAALALLTRIDKQAGREAMLAWFTAIQQAGKQVSNEQLAALALQYTKVDIAADLK